MGNFTGSDWCGWCKLIDKNVFHHADFPAIAKELNLVLVYVDFPNDKSLVPEKYKERNSTLSDKYGVGGYPTYVLLNSDLEKVGQLGAGREKTPKSFGDEIKAVLRKSPAAVEKKAAELGDRGEEFKASFVAFKKAESDLDAWLETKPPRNAENEKLFETYQAAIKAAEESSTPSFESDCPGLIQKCRIQLVGVAAES